MLHELNAVGRRDRSPFHAATSPALLHRDWKCLQDSSYDFVWSGDCRRIEIEATAKVGKTTKNEF